MSVETKRTGDDMTPEQYKKYQETLFKEACNAIIEREMNEQWEREQQGLMHQLDQDDPAIQDFCNWR